MKTIIGSFFISCVLLLCGCRHGQNTYTVSGMVNDTSYNGKTVYINLYGTFDKIDSTRIKDCRYTFSGMTDTARLCYIFIPGQKGKSFILEKGDICLPEKYSCRPSGTPMNDALTRISTELDSLDLLYSQKLQSLEPDMTEEAIEREWDPFFRHYKETIRQRYLGICRAHPDDALGHYAIIEFMDRVNSDVKRQVYPHMGTSIQTTRIFQHDKKKLDNEMKAEKGMHFSDFEGQTADGRRISLSDYVGKGHPVVMDVWASWCVPCRKEISNLHKLYQQYHKDGLEIVGVFIKDSPENLRKMVKDEQIDWPQIMDEAGDILKLYGAVQIPQIILFDAEGTIVRRNLHGRELMQTVKSYMQDRR